MIKKVQKLGDNYASVIEETILDVLGIDADSDLQITVSGNALIITPVNVGVDRKRIAEAIDKLRSRYGEMLERLAG